VDLEQNVLTDAVGAIMVTATGTGASCNVFLSAYSAPFNPSSICSNHVWDSGSSSGLPPNFSNLDIAFTATPKSPLYFVVEDTSASGGGSPCVSTVTLTVSGVADAVGAE
jgi:hypothetical protein